MGTTEAIAGMTGVVAKMSRRIGEDWEHTLQLHIQPKPRWMPLWLWRRLLLMVLRQSAQTNMIIDLDDADAPGIQFEMMAVPGSRRRGMVWYDVRSGMRRDMT